MRTQSGMDKDGLKFIALLLWFENLWQGGEEGSKPSAAWSEEMIPCIVPMMTKWLSRHKGTTSGEFAV